MNKTDLEVVVAVVVAAFSVAIVLSLSMAIITGFMSLSLYLMSM